MDPPSNHGLTIAAAILALCALAIALTALVLNQTPTPSGPTADIVEILSTQCGPLTFGMRGDVWNERYEIDANNDTVVSGAELCSLYGGVCLFTQPVEYDQQSEPIPHFGGPISGCFESAPNEDFEQRERRALLAWCCQVGH